MKIKWTDEKLTPTEIARRILDGAMESAYFWDDRFREDGENPPTKKQVEAIHRQVIRLAESVRKRYRITHDAGRNPKVSKTGR